MSETPDNGTAEDEMISEDLLALLYPDEDAPAPVASMGDLDELEDLRGMRSLFRDMPDEEPPEAISNKLLAMAAQNAPKAAKKPEESKGLFLWLSDFLLPAVYHPGLAAAASLVLVAGLGLTLYVNGQSQVAEPQVASQAVAPSEVALREPAPAPAQDPGDQAFATETATAEEEAPAAAAADNLQAELAEEDERNQADGYYGLDGNKTPARLGDSQGQALGGVRGGGGSGPGANIAESKSRRRAAPAKPAPTVKKPKTSAGKSGGKAPDGLLKDLSGADSLDFKKNDKKEAEKPPVTRSTGKGKGSSTTAPAPDPESKPEPPPPPKETTPEPSPDRSVDKSAPVVDAEEGDDDDDDDADDSGAGEDESKIDPREQAANLHQKAIGAAKKGNCDKVKSLGQQIRKLSSVYYDRSFLSDKKLKACLAPAPKKKK